MTLTAASSLRDVVLVVSRALHDHGVRAVLTGGACASLHSRGDYLSHDLDYILQNRATQATVEIALASVGFSRVGASYQHPRSSFFVEFPAGPLAIGDDDLVEPVELRVGRAVVLTLSATDSCRDRLAAFYFWNDRQSLNVAVKIARHGDVDLAAVRAWSTREQQAVKFGEFSRLVNAQHSARKRISKVAKK